jgi:hypothetical protein
MKVGIIIFYKAWSDATVLVNMGGRLGHEMLK